MHRENTHTEKKRRPLCIYKIYIEQRKRKKKKEGEQREEKIYMHIYIYDSVHETDHNTIGD
jgi:hypothetical protein